MANQPEDLNTDKFGLKPIVLVDKNRPQIFDFDKAVTFSEKPVNKRTTVSLLKDDGSDFTAETSVLYGNRIRIVYSKVESLIEGEIVNISLKDSYKDLQHDYLLNIPCSVVKVDNYDYITHAVIIFQDPIDSQFLEWYQQWLADDIKTNKNDEKEFNFIYRYYKRLYCNYLAYPFLFSDGHQIRYAFTSKPGSAGISFVDENNANIRLPISILQSYVKNQSKGARMPIYFWYENDLIHYFSNADHPNISPKLLISWVTKKPQWRVLLMRTRKVVPVNEIQREEVSRYVTEEAIVNASDFEKSLSELTSTTNIIDISCLFAHIKLPAYKTRLSAKEAIVQEAEIYYQILSFNVKRDEPRYDYRTKVTLTTLNQSQKTTLSAETSDISFLGMNIMLPNHNYSFDVGDSIVIGFTQWNKKIARSLFNKEKQLKKVEYEIVELEQQHDLIRLGIKRDNREASSSFDNFIRKKIDDLKQTEVGHIRNDFDLYKSLISSLWINNNIAGLAFFLGRDSEGIRIIQGIVNTQENLNLRKPYKDKNDWSFLQQIAPSLGLAINSINSDKSNYSNRVDIGIYCYYDDRNEPPRWITKTDLDFKSVERKYNFISTAIRYKKRYFYHCSLVPITSRIDDILMGEASSFFSLGAHRLKEIHEISRSLLAIGELNDVTRLIEFMYQSD